MRWLLLWLALLFAAAVRSEAQLDTGRVSFKVSAAGQTTNLRILALGVLPGRQLSFEVVESPADARYEAHAVLGAVESTGPRAWNWTAPADPGLAPVVISSASTAESITLNVFVLVPRGEVTDGNLNGYRIGGYPEKPLKGLDIYLPPGGFIEVTAENVDTPVSPHFRLGQFLCKQESDYPKYLVLRPRLLMKLELILAHVNAAGYRCDTFHVMSGYRTPYYNAAIGNVKYSRHVWGGAADIFIDVDPEDGMMDDLDRNGQINIADAAVLYDLIDDLYGKPFYTRFLGGLGRYRETSAHGPFVHVDVRGFRARWGD